MKLAPVALLLTLTAAALAQAPTPAPFQPPHLHGPFTDPANLRGERVTPLNGHELPIDGGDGDNALGLAQLLRKLSTRASLMLIVAHPDDEDGGMLTLYSRGLGARVATLTLNRGEGGQNAMTGDFEDALGLIRTQELLSADRYFDASQMFGTEVDFGFSKTKQESFAKWGHQRVLYDVVRAIRIYRPLVIASVFIGGVTDGHGQHQVAGEIAQEAFLSAGDPTVFPSLTAEGILPWSPLKVYARVPRQAITPRGLFDYATGQYTPARFTNYVTGAVTTTLPSTDVVIHEGTTDPLLTPAAANPADLAVNPGERDLLANPTTPLSYAQFARIGLGLQRSQIGPGMRLPPPGAFDIAYHLYGSRLCNAPTTARPPAMSVESRHPEADGVPGQLAGRDGQPKDLCIPPTPTTNLSSRPESSRLHREDVAERPAVSPTPALPPTALTTNPTFFTGIDTSLTGIADLAPDAPPSLKAALAGIAASLEKAQHDFNPSQPAAIAPLLSDAQHQIGRLLGNMQGGEMPPGMIVLREQQAWHSVPALEIANLRHELLVKETQTTEALALALGLQIDATSALHQNNIVAGGKVAVAVHLTTTSTEPLQLIDADFDDAPSPNGSGHDYSHHPPLSTSSPVELELTADAPLTSTITRPYFTRDSIEQPYYDLLRPQLRNAPQTPAPLEVSVILSYRGQIIPIDCIVHSGPQPISIIPPISVALQPHAQVVPLAERTFSVFMTATPPGAAAATSLDGPRAWRTGSVKTTGDTDKFTLTLPLGERTPFTLTGTALTQSGQKFTEGFRPVGYPGLIYTNYFTPATDRIVPVDLNLPPANQRRIAYLPGTGDAVPEALASIGLTPTILTVADLTPNNLAKYDTVILGVRTYNAHPDLHGAPTHALLDFARNGGNVLVQYQTAEFTAADAPYPLTLGRSAEKVVDETTPVKLLQPDNPLLTTPNRITPADFNDWIEERGHGFLQSWDPHYTALTETHDPEATGPGGPETAPQVPQLGGLITTQLGRGRWTYCAFALYRQLPEAVPGAFRLFVNLLTP